MSIFDLFRTKSALHPPLHVHIPYPEIQKYFQLFTTTIRRNTPLKDKDVVVPATIFQSYKSPKATVFFDPETTAETTSVYANACGGAIYAGSLITHGTNGGFVEYLYIVLTDKTAPDVTGYAKFDPYFVFLGECIAGAEQQLIKPLFILTKSDKDEQGPFPVQANITSAEDVISAMAFAEPVFRAIHADIPLDAASLIADFKELDRLTHYNKFRWLAENRTPQFFQDELAHLREYHAAQNAAAYPLQMENK